MGIFKVRKVGMGFFWGLFLVQGFFWVLLVALGIYWDLTGAYTINFFPHLIIPSSEIRSTLLPPGCLSR